VGITRRAARRAATSPRYGGSASARVHAASLRGASPGVSRTHPLDERHALDARAEQRGDRHRHRPAEGVTHERHPLGAQRAHHRVPIAHEVEEVVIPTVSDPARAPVPAVVHEHHAVGPGQRLGDGRERAGVVERAVEAHDERPVGRAGDVVREVEPAHRQAALFEPLDHGFTPWAA
jgi:hypothetical protein